MKKRIVKIIIGIIVCFVLCLSATAIFSMDLHTHDYSVTIIPADCMNNGKTIYKCECGDIYEDNFVDATGHNFIATIVEPSCIAEGCTIETCSYCNYAYQHDIIEATGHMLSDWELTINPTVTSDGEESRICKCGYTETRVYVCNHEKVFKSILKDATCQEEGVLQEICSLCNKVLNESLIEVINHDFGEWEITTQANPLQHGIKQRYCKNCNLSETSNFEFHMVGPNSVYIESANINVNYIVADFTQDAVDTYDVICNYTRLNKNNPIILGHNTGSLKKLYNTSIDSYIYLFVDGVLNVYKVIVSERAIETNNRTELEGLETGYELLNRKSLGGETLRLYTCYQDAELGKIRWIVCAEKVNNI